MNNIIWLIVMIPVSAFFTGLGIYAWKRKKPMWFWSGSKVDENEISDVQAYNKANGIMWIAFSGILWLSVFLGIRNMEEAGYSLLAGCIIGVPALPIAYGKIYARYRK